MSLRDREFNSRLSGLTYLKGHPSAIEISITSARILDTKVMAKVARDMVVLRHTKVRSALLM